MKKCAVCRKLRNLLVLCPIDGCNKWYCGLCVDHEHGKRLKKVKKIKFPDDKTKGDL